jgi:ricin-type beta-trefoil lectin protein
MSHGTTLWQARERRRRSSFSRTRALALRVLSRPGMRTLLHAFLCMSVGCGVELPDDDLDTTVADLDGVPRFNPADLGIVSLHNGTRTCPGVLVRSSGGQVVLSSRVCAGAPGPLTVSLTNTATGTVSFASALPGSTTYQDGSVDLLMVFPDSSLPVKNGGRTLSGSLPSGAPIRCFGFDAAGALHSRLFGIDSQGLLTTNMSVTGGIRLDDPLFAFQPNDRGAPCIEDVNDIFGTPLVAIVGATGAATVGAVGTSNIAQWIDDMNQLRLARFHDPTVVSVSNLHLRLLLDVAWASVKPNEPVNQIHNNGQLNQEWIRQWWPNVTNANAYISTWSGKCLEVGPDNQLRQNSCTGAATQLFRNEAFNGSLRIHPRSADTWCLDVPFSSTSDGTRVQIFPCHSGLNQQWDLIVR